MRKRLAFPVETLSFFPTKVDATLAFYTFLNLFLLSFSSLSDSKIDGCTETENHTGLCVTCLMPKGKHCRNQNESKKPETGLCHSVVLPPVLPGTDLLPYAHTRSLSPKRTGQGERKGNTPWNFETDVHVEAV